MNNIKTIQRVLFIFLFDLSYFQYLKMSISYGFTIHSFYCKVFFNELCHMQIPNVILFDNKYWGKVFDKGGLQRCAIPIEYAAQGVKMAPRNE